MNDVLDIVRDQRPSAPALDAATRNRIRARLTEGSPATAPADPDERPTELRNEPGHAAARRRSWLSVAAVIIVGLGLAGLAGLVTRPDTIAPADPPPVNDVDESVLSPSTAVTLPASSTAPTSQAIAIPGPAFTPLLLAEPPDGYALITAKYGTGEGGVGIVTYAHPGHETQLQILVRDRADMLDLPAGRPQWQIGDHLFVDDNQGEGCLPDVCSIGTMWDDHTYVSLMWVDPNGGNLVAGADRDALVALASQLGENTDGWLPITDPIELGGISGGDESLLLPPDAVVVDSATALSHGPPGSRSVVLQAPDGTMQVMWQRSTPLGAPAGPAFGDSRTIAGIEWSGDASSQVALYNTGLSCSSLTIGDGGAGAGTGLWRDEIVALLGSVSEDNGTTVVSLPVGWSRVGSASGEPTYEASFELQLVGAAGTDVMVSVVLDQSPGTSGGAIPDTASPRIETADNLGNPAWTATDPAHPEFVGLAWFDGTTSRYAALTAPTGVDATTLVKALLTELNGWGTASVSTWLQTVGASSATQEQPGIATDACGPRGLLVLS